MNLKKILAAIAACAVAASMVATTAFAAGVDGDGETIDDTDATTSETIDEGDAAEDEEPAADTETEPEAAPEVSNPTTGNAPIALAVIPVALAAAAVVAKKAK